MIIKQIIPIEDWGISSMKERQISVNKVPTNFTYWDYSNVFNKVLYYNNERHKHTWFIKVCAKIFVNPITNWFLNWWSYHDPTTKILPEPFLKLYKEWVKIHKWTPKVGFTEEQILCLYRTYYNNIWDKLMKKDPKTKSLYGNFFQKFYDISVDIQIFKLRLQFLKLIIFTRTNTTLTSIIVAFYEQE
ncbi:hypothetical protein H5410_060490 [Solanum commersonii]|uniref:Uncharacterized protein n=1 Tax=Solanum commersonii TaxID=4109 RepID=A0A9J5W659_SOLCO|nr:hypothetical protein H5410_060490 [Solanum commersonii]